MGHTYQGKAEAERQTGGGCHEAAKTCTREAGTDEGKSGRGYGTAAAGATPLRTIDLDTVGGGGLSDEHAFQ